MLKLIRSFVVIGILFQSLIAEAATQNIDQAVEYFEAGEFQKTVDLLEPFVSKALLENRLSEDDALIARKYLGMSYSLLGEGDKAVREFKRMIVADPTFNIRSFGENPPSRVIQTFGLYIGQKIRCNGGHHSGHLVLQCIGRYFKVSQL